MDSDIDLTFSPRHNHHSMYNAFVGHNSERQSMLSANRKLLEHFMSHYSTTDRKNVF